MDAFWGPFQQNSTVSGTSELFSSSVAMIGDGYQPYQENWVDQPKQVIPMNFPSFFEQPTEVIPIIQETPVDYGNTGHVDQQAIYSTSYENATSYPVYHAEQMAQVQLVARHQAAQQELVATEEARQKEHYFAQKIVDSGIAGMSPAPISTITIPINPHHTPGNDSGIGIVTPSRRPSSVCGSDVPGRSPVTSSESGIENDGSPGGSEVNPSDMEEGEGRVMCYACKGLYPSRRSLTGHIGRNEKCREIIGRSYLDQVAAGAIPITTPDTNLRASAMANGHDGLSPICPHCDKFISHYKGNIRRHINSCGKNGTFKKLRPDKEKERKRRRRIDEGPPQVLQEGFEPTPPTFNSIMYNHPSQQMSSYAPTPQEDHHMIPQQPKRMHMPAAVKFELPTEPSPPNPPKRDDPPEDAYICGLCDFVTIYKGNMKRHLNTCHKSNDCKDLKEWDRKLESMRASSLGMSREEMLQRLHQHRMNSTRGRKPGKRTTQESIQSTQHLSPVHISHMPSQMNQARLPPVQVQQYTVPSIQQQSMHPNQGMNVHMTQQEQMVLQSHLPMTIHSQEAEMFSMPQMPHMHYGYDMGGYI